MTHNNAILESIDLVRVHLTSLVVTATVPPTSRMEDLDARTAALLAALTEATYRVQGNRSPYSSMSWADLRLLLAGYLRVYLAHLEQEP